MFKDCACVFAYFVLFTTFDLKSMLQAALSLADIACVLRCFHLLFEHLVSRTWGLAAEWKLFKWRQPNSCGSLLWNYNNFCLLFDIPTTFLMKAMLLRGQQLGITRGNHGCYGFASGFGTKPEYNTLSSGLHLLYYLLLKHVIFFFCSSTGISRLYLSIRGALTKP